VHLVAQAAWKIALAVGAKAATAAAFANAVVAVTTTVLVNTALGAVQKAIAGKQLTGTRDAFTQNVTQRSTIAARRIVYGKRRVSGALAFYGVSSSGVAGAINDRFCSVIVLAGHQVNAITDVWVDNVRIPEADIDSSGNVTAGQYAGAMRIWKHLGTGGQAADVNLVADYPTEWSTNHRLAGCAYIVVRCGRSDTAFPQGAPSQFSALVEGALVYDPRRDSTNGGSGSHRYDDASTWEYSANPALHARHWLTGGSIVNDQVIPMRVYGVRDDDTRIDDAAVIAAANICDEVLTGVNSTPDGDAIRYECHLEASSDQTNRTVLTDILESMAGSAVVRKGKWVIEAGAYVTPEHTLTQAHIYGDLKTQDTDTQRDRYNAVSATYTDVSKGYVDATCPMRTDSAYEAQDGDEQIPIELTLKGVTDQYQAQRLCEIKLRKSRMQRRVVIPGARDILKIGLNEAFLLTFPRYGWTSRIYRCTDRQFEFDQDAGRVMITAQRDDPAVYNDLLTGDYATGTSNTDTFQVDGPSSPLSLSAGGTPTSILLAWTTDGNDAGVVSRVWEYTSSTPRASATLVYQGAAKWCVLPKSDTTTRYYWVDRINAAGQISGSYPSGAGVSAAASTVGTTMITAGAATLVATVTDAGPNAGGWAGVVEVDDIFATGSISAQSVACYVFLTLTTDALADTSGALADLTLQTVVSGVTTSFDTYQTNGTLSKERVTLQSQVSLAAGSSLSFQAIAAPATGPGTGSVAFTNTRIEVNVILR